MNIEQVIQELEAEQSRIAKALEALGALRGTAGLSTSGQPQLKKQKMSASTRRKLSLAQKERWAKARSGSQGGVATKAAKGTAKRKTMSPAVRAKLRAAYAKNHPGWKPKR
jgi:hypothetical protein